MAAELKRSMGFFALLALSISSMVSTEMFTGAAIGAKYAGPSSIIAWVILGAVSIYVALCYGELCAMFPKAGGNYEYAKQTYGKFISYIIGWGTWILSNLMMVLILTTAINSLVPGAFPVLYKVLIVSGFVILLNFVAYKGIEASAMLMIIFAAITVFMLFAIFFKGIFAIHPINFTPFFGALGISGIITTVLLLAESILGWESATYLSEETENPEKKVPMAILIATLFAAIINILVAIVMLGVIPSQNLANIGDPFSAAAKMLFGAGIISFLNMGIYLILLGSAASVVVSTPRLLLAMARDKLFLKELSSIHPKYKTPYKAIIFQTIVSLLLIFVGFGRYDLLLKIVIPLAILIYSTIIIAVAILRFRKPEIKRPFKVPFGKIGPVIVVLFFIAAVVFWAMTEKGAVSLIVMGLLILAISIPVYFLLEMYYNPKAIKFVNNMLAYVYYLSENIFIPKKIRASSIGLLGNVKGKKVLDYACNVGTFTVPLTEAVGKNGKIFSTDISEKVITIVMKRAARKNIKNVKAYLSDPEKINKNIPVVDAALSMGGASIVQDEIEFLKHLNKRLKKNGRVVFVEYDKFFHIIPNANWLSDDKHINNCFSKSGFEVKIIRKKGIFWTYIFIIGNKVKNI